MPNCTIPLVSSSGLHMLRRTYGIVWDTSEKGRALASGKRLPTSVATLPSVQGRPLKAQAVSNA